MTQHRGPSNSVTLIWFCHRSAVRSAEKTRPGGSSAAPVWRSLHIAFNQGLLLNSPFRYSKNSFPLDLLNVRFDIDGLMALCVFVCACLCRGICGATCLSRIGCSEMLSCCRCRGWPVKLLLVSLTFTNTTSCTGSTSELQH